MEGSQIKELRMTNELIKGLAQIPIEFVLVPVIGKRAILKNWTNIKLSRDELIKFIQVKKPDGYTIVLGPTNNGIVAVDIDGYGCYSEYEKIFGYLPNDDKNTVKVTSGKPGRRCEFYQIPATYWESIESKEIHTGIFDSDDKEENLELRWAGKMQNLPPSTHPDTGKTYQYISSFEESIIAEAPLALIERMLKTLSVRPEQSRPLTIPSDYYDLVSIEQIISKECRDLLGGVAEGGRNNIGAKLSRALIGAEESAKRLGINLSDTAEQLFYDFCQRCTPAIPGKEADNIWKNALKDNPTSTLPDDAILNCVKAHQRKQNQSYGGKSRTKSKQSNQSNQLHEPEPLPMATNVIPINTPLRKLTIEDLTAELETMANSLLTSADLEKRFIELSVDFGLPIPVIRQYYSEIEKKHSTESRDLKQDLAEYQKCLAVRLVNSKLFLPGPLRHVSTMCKNLGFLDEAGILLLMTGISAMIHADTYLVVDDVLNFTVGPTIFSCLIAESGMKKSPLLRNIIKDAIRVLAKKENKRYEQAMADWELLSDDEKKSNPKPNRRCYMINGGTSEGIRNLVAGNKGSGILRFLDELKGLWSQQGKYSNGIGDDRQQLIESYDGYLPEVARASVDGNIAGTAEKVNLPVIGGIQPDILHELFLKDEHDSDGLMARFMFVTVPTAPAYIKPDRRKPVDLLEYLEGLYRRISEQRPQRHNLSDDAYKIFVEVYNSCEAQKMKGNPPAIQYQINKLPGKIAKIALVLHYLLSVVQNPDQPVPEIVEMRTMQLAIDWGNYQINQCEAIYHSFDNSEIAPLLEKILAKTPPEGITASVLKSNIRILRNKSISEVNDLIQVLVKSGYGFTRLCKGGIKFFRGQELD
jgi:hypothetical protein